MNRELISGDPGKVLVSYTIPLFASVIFQQLYSIADSVIAGKFAGEDALAAIGAGYPVTMIFMAVAIGCQIGCSVVISRLFGAGDIKGTKTSISTAVIAGSVLSFLLMLVGVIFSAELMELVNTPENIFEQGNLYLKIYTGGFVFLFLYNVITGIFNSLGDSKTPLFMLIGSSVGNILLDALFVIKFGWGAAGTAWATFIAQGAACIFSAAVLYHRVRDMKTSEAAPKFSFGALMDISSVAVPSILQQSFISVGNMVIQYLVNGFGSSVIAGYSAAIKLNTFAVTGFTTLGNGISGFTAQNLGAEKPERVRKGFRYGLIFALAAAGVFFLAFFFFGRTLLSLFMNNESSQLAEDTGVMFLRIVSPFYFVVCTKLACDGVLRGAEKMGYFMAATFTDLIMRVVLAFVFSGFMGETGIWAAWPISWTVAAVMSLYFYIKGVWNKESNTKHL